MVVVIAMVGQERQGRHREDDEFVVFDLGMIFLDLCFRFMGYVR